MKMRLCQFIRQIDKLIQSPYIAALLISVLIAILLLNEVFLGVFSGVRLWGDWFNVALGLNDFFQIESEPDNPLYHRISLITISFLLGALAIALITKKFSLGFAGKQDILWSGVGGCFMGLGATLAGGCTIGGFYTPISLSGPTGFVMLIGLFTGSLAGYQCLMWAMCNMKWGKSKRASIALTSKWWQIVGLLIIVGLIGWAASWYFSGQSRLSHRALIIVVGLCLGTIMQRSRFCFSSAIRSPILSGNFLMTKAIMLLLLLGALINGLLVNYLQIDVYQAIPPTLWLGSLFGGAFFGFGMILGGGCASGVLWRTGEGNLKALTTLFFMGWSGSTFTAIGKSSGLLSREITADWHEVTVLGQQLLLNQDFSGYIFSIIITSTFISCWYLLIKLAQKKQWYV